MLNATFGETNIPQASQCSNQGNTIMGDRSPKSNNKQAGQKKSKSDKAASKKKQAIASKQVGTKKK